MPPKKILLVEGVDDEHVFKALFGKLQLPHLDEIKQCGGYDSLVEILPVQLKASDVHSLGIVVDADTDASRRWKSIRTRLIGSGYDSLPSTP
jgi:hypothetical protein